MFRQRRVAIPVRHGLDAEPLCLELVVAVGKPRIGRLHGGHEGIDHLILDDIGEVAEGLRPLVLAPAVVDLLVLDQRVGDQREDRDVLALHLAERLGGVAPHLGFLARELVEDLRLAERLSAEGVAQARDGLVEQARPGAAHHRLVVDVLLELVRQVVRAEGAKVAQPGRILGERRLVHLLGEVGVLDLVELEAEEQQLAADVVQLLRSVLREAAALGIGHVLGIVELGIGADAADHVGQGLETRDRRPQPLAVQPADLAFVVLGKGFRLGRRALEVGIELGARGAGIEVFQLPGRQFAQHRGHLNTPYLLPISGSAAMASRNGPISRAANGSTLAGSPSL